MSNSTVVIKRFTRGIYYFERDPRFEIERYKGDWGHVDWSIKFNGKYMVCFDTLAEAKEFVQEKGFAWFVSKLSKAQKKEYSAGVVSDNTAVTSHCRIRSLVAGTGAVLSW